MKTISADRIFHSVIAGVVVLLTLGISALIVLLVMKVMRAAC